MEVISCKAMIKKIGLVVFIAFTHLGYAEETNLQSTYIEIEGQPGVSAVSALEISEVTFLIKYQPTPQEPSSGTGIQVFYDSTLFELSATPSHNPAALVGFGIESDLSDGDSNELTKSYLNIAYASFSSFALWDAGASYPLTIASFTLAVKEGQTFEGKAPIVALVPESGLPAGYQADEKKVFEITFPDVTSPNLVDGVSTTLTLAGDRSGVSSTSTAVTDFFASLFEDNTTSQSNLVITSDAPGTFPANSETTVTVTAEDEAGNSASQEVTVVVEDQAAPVIGNTELIEKEADALGGLAFNQTEFLGALGITDNVDDFEDLTITLDIQGEPVAAVLAVDTYSVNVTVTDTSDNFALQPITLRVVDTTPPVITAGTVPEIQAPDPTPIPASDERITTWLTSITATDIVDGNISLDGKVTVPSEFVVGDNTVTVQNVQDTQSNTADLVTYTIKVLGDEEKPVITLSSGPTLVLEAEGPDGVGDSGEGGAQISAFLESGSATDNLATDLIVYSEFVDGAGDPLSLDSVPLGVTAVRFFTQDNFGNTAEALGSITVQDTTKPVISGAGGSVTLSAVDASGAPSDTSVSNLIDAVTASDLVSGDVTVTNDAPSQFSLGETTITFSAEDAEGNIATATATVSVEDDTAPVLTLLDNPAVEATGPDGAPLSVEQILARVAATDNVDSELFPEIAAINGVTFGPGDQLPEAFPLGEAGTEVTIIVKDAASNSDEVLLKITVVDTTPPEIVGEDLDLFFSPEAKETGILVVEGDEVSQWAESIIAKDLVVSPLTVTYTLPTLILWGPTSSGAAEATEVVFESTDGTNLGSRTFLIKPYDDFTPPELTVPADLTVEATGADGVTDDASDSAKAIAEFLEAATATDNVDGDISSAVLADEALPFALGTTTVTFTVADQAGNESKDTATVTVEDTTAPVISGELTATFAAIDANGRPISEADVEAFIEQITASDVVSGSVDVEPVNPVEVFPLGETSVDVTATDAAGNVAKATVVVKVTDQTKPVVIGSTLTVEATGPTGAPVTAAQITAKAQATDNVDGVIGTVVADTLLTAYPIGATEVTVAATDAAGNTGTGIVTVVVQDTTGPVLTGSDLTIQLKTPDEVIASTDARITAWVQTVTATDIVEGASVVTPTLPAEFKLGTTAVTFATEDKLGNKGASLSLNVILTPDEVDPVVKIGAGVTAEAASAAGVAATDTAAKGINDHLATATASDDVDGDISSSITNNASYPFALGDTKVTLTVKDTYGNSGSATTTVTVVDTTPPTFTGSLIGTFAAVDASGTPSTAAEIEAFGDQVGAVDLVDGEVDVEADVPAVFPIGKTLVAITATDSRGNKATGEVTVIVEDQAAPVLTGGAITLEATSADGASLSEADLLALAAGTDNVDTVVTVELGAELPAAFPLGVTEFPVVATDNGGNKGSAVVTITVEDTTAPEISGDDFGIQSTDPDIVITADDEQIQEWLSSITAKDVVDGEVAVAVEVPAEFAAGTTELTFTAVDAAGNEASAVFALSIAEDEVPPELTVPEPITVDASSALGVEAGSESAEYIEKFLAGGQATDNFEGDISSAITTDFEYPAGFGETTVTFTVSDRFGNSDTGTSTITVVDTAGPVITQNRSATFAAVDASGIPSSADEVQAYVSSLTAEDLLDGTLPVELDLPEVLPLGITSVIGRAEDSSGNSSAARFTLTVSDQTGPVITTTVTVVEAEGPEGSFVRDAEILGQVSVVDNVDLAPFVYVLPRESQVAPLGESVVLVGAEDADGNKSTAEALINVVDTTAPTFPGAVNLGIQLQQEGEVPSTDARVAEWIASIKAVDSVEGAVPVTVGTLPAAFPMGKTVVAFTAQDSGGNARTIELKVSVFVGPKIDVPAGPIVVSPDGAAVSQSNAVISAWIASVTAADTQGNALDVTSDAPDTFPVGETEVTFTATDSSSVSNTESGIVTVIEASADSDLDGDGMDDLFESTYGLDPNDPNDRDGDLDGDGKTNIEEYLEGMDPSVDDVPPTVVAPDDVTVNSAGYKTAVDLGEAVATDFLDGDLVATPSDKGPFLSGAHLIIWSVEDAAGNFAMDEQFVFINPRVNTVKKKRTAEGETLSLQVVLNGRATGYPLEVPFTLGGTAEAGVDYIIEQEAVVFEEGKDDGRVSEILIQILADANDDEGNETIEVTLGAPESGAVLGVDISSEITIVEEAVPPALDLKVAQGETTGRKVTQNGGRVIVTLTINDPNGQHTIDWSATDNNLVPLNGTSGETFEFNPQEVSGGSYKVNVSVEDSGLPGDVFSTKLTLIVTEEEVIVSDSDNDGIPDDQDTSNEANVLAVDASSSEEAVTADNGVKLVIGGAAASSGKAGVAVDENTIASSGEDGGEAPGNGNDEDFDYPQGIYDFEVTEMPIPGETVNIVIPLGSDGIPADAVYRKYTEATGWVDFVVDEANAIASAPGADGACPDSGDEAFEPGLIEGYRCIQLSLQDGGPNDADGEINGIIDDPGGIAVEAPVQVVEINAEGYQARKKVGGGCTVSTNANDPGLLILMLAALGYLFRRRFALTRR